MKFFFLALVFIAGCSTVASSSPHSLYTQAIAKYSNELRDGAITDDQWLDRSDTLLLQYFTGDFRIPSFIQERRMIYKSVESGQISQEHGARRIVAAFDNIREETEARFYAQQLNLRYAEVMQDIQTKGLFAQSVAGDIGIIGGLALRRALR